MANSQPRTDPENPENVRLERVRRERGYSDSLWNFWKELCSHPPGDLKAKTDNDGNYQISYEAVRNYHYNRHAPGHYYGQVARVFGVRLEWLISGDGGMTHDEDNALRAAEASGFEYQDGMFVDTAWSDEERRAAHLRRHIHSAKGWVSFALGREIGDITHTFLNALLSRKGPGFIEGELTGGPGRNTEENDVIGYLKRTVVEPLAEFKNAPYAQRMSAFHNRMAMLWLQEFGEDRWG